MQHWIGVGFAEVGVFYSAEDYIEHIGWHSERYLVSEWPKLDWCNVKIKKNKKVIHFFSGLMGGPVFLLLEKKRLLFLLNAKLTINVFQTIMCSQAE